MMIGGLSLLVVLALIVPVWADLEDDKKEICSYYHGEWEDGNCNLENENLRDEYNDEVAYAEDSYAIDRKQEEQDVTLAFAESDNEEICSGVGGEWEDGKCRADIDSNDKDEIEEEQTAIDDALCDNNSDKMFDICQSTKSGYGDDD